MKINFLSALFGTKKADTTEAVETITANVQTVASSEPVKNDNETVIFTTEAVAKMTPAEALAKLQNQLSEKKASIFEKATTTEKIKKELEKATKKATDTEAEAITTEATSTNEKEIVCKRYIANFWHTITEELNTLYTDTVKKEAEAKAKAEAVKAKAAEALAAVTVENITDTVAVLSTEELEALATVATEKAKEAKEKAKKATDTATEKNTITEAVAVAVAQRHQLEGRASEKEIATVAISEVFANGVNVWALATEKINEGMKAVAKLVKAALETEYTVSKAIKAMKAESDTWQKIFNTLNISVKVAEITPANIFANLHPFLSVPTGKGVKAGRIYRGNSLKAVEKWTVESLFKFIVTNSVLNSMNICEAEKVAHLAKVEKAEKALATVEELKELAKKAKAEKAEAKAKADTLANVEKTPVCTVAELDTATANVETATANVETITEAVKAAKAEAAEATEAVKVSIETTTATVKAAKAEARKVTTNGRGRGTGNRGTKKATTEKATETTKAVKAATNGRGRGTKKADTATVAATA